MFAGFGLGDVAFFGVLLGLGVISGSGGVEAGVDRGKAFFMIHSTNLLILFLVLINKRGKNLLILRHHPSLALQGNSLLLIN